ncbi:DUF2975 domain-containing protein [uncultured Maribacter sp.]|uniref:DUF2975 domain-containing protein n=1 Tax=uncultured Maribacter sp. TaxID=431308 RepID=UPI0030ED09B6|tara:strand:- start:100513 stop:101037 length:525 start_codon:yes stop_codon:yes gene_type:complete
MKSKSSFSILINFLYFIVLFSIFGLAISIIDKTYLFTKSLLTQFNTLSSFSKNYNVTILQLFSFTEILLMIYMLWLLFKVNKITYGDNSNLFFSKKNGKIFKLLGSGLIYYAIGFFLINIISSAMIKFGLLGEYNQNVTLSELIYLVVIAIFILIISKIIKDGYELKKENDLTI